jgi:hypothetical protein
MKNAVFWNVTPCDVVLLRSVRRLLVTANAVPSSSILVTLMTGAMFLRNFGHCISSQRASFASYC